MSDPVDLDEIEKWAAEVFRKHECGNGFAMALCAYTDELPTRSIRSQMVALVAALRVVEARNAHLLNALKTAREYVTAIETPHHAAKLSVTQVIDHALAGELAQ